MPTTGVIDLTTELSELATEEAIAARSCAEAAMARIQGWTGAEVAVAAFGQSQQSQAAIMGLIELLLHKGTLSQAELGDSMAHGYHQRAAELREQVKKPSLILPSAPAARHRQ
jgi:hypothetical protein